MKIIISKEYWHDMKKIQKNSEVFTKSRWIWFKLCCRQGHQILVEIRISAD